MNKCNFIGKIYREPKITYTSKQNAVARFCLVVLDPYNKNKKNYIPMVAYKSIAEKVAMLCRNGNTVAVESIITTSEHFNRELCYSTIQLYFIATDVMLLSKATKNQITNKTFSDLVNTYSLEN